MLRQTVSSMVFEGGSVKGAAYPGAIAALIELGAIEMATVRRFAGTSAGSITAALISVGYVDPIEIRQLMLGERSIDFTQLMPAGEIFKLQDASKTFKEKPVARSSSRLFTQPAKKTAAASKASAAASSASYKIFSSACLIDGEVLREFMERLISQKVLSILQRKQREQGAAYAGPAGTETFSKFLTFEMLHQLSELYPEDFKDLYVVSYNLAEQRAVTFSHEDEQWKNLVISDAVRMSVSIPFLFAPHTPHYRQHRAGSAPVREKGEECPLFIDGGVDSNYPLKLFDDYAYFSRRGPDQTGHFINPETLGFSLMDPKQKNYLKTGQAEVDERYLGSASFIPLVQAVLHAYMGKQKRAHIENAEDTVRTVHINTLGIGMLDIQIGEVQKWALFESGRQAVYEKFADGQVFSSHPENPYSRFTEKMLSDANQQAGSAAAAETADDTKLPAMATRR